VYTKFQYVNNAAAVADFASAVAPTGFVALKRVLFEINGRSVDRPRLEANASWATFTYYDKLLIHVEGDVVAATPAQYNVYWQAMLQKLLPAPEALQTDRTQGALVFRLEGLSEDYSIPVVVETPPQTPKEVNMAPSASPFMCVFKAFRPYAFGLTSETYYWVT
jgi:hypothetical protein